MLCSITKNYDKLSESFPTLIILQFRHFELGNTTSQSLKCYMIQISDALFKILKTVNYVSLFYYLILIFYLFITLFKVGIHQLAFTLNKYLKTDKCSTKLVSEGLRNINT